MSSEPKCGFHLSAYPKHRGDCLEDFSDALETANMTSESIELTLGGSRGVPHDPFRFEQRYGQVVRYDGNSIC